MMSSVGVMCGVVRRSAIVVGLAAPLSLFAQSSGDALTRSQTKQEREMAVGSSRSPADELGGAPTSIT